MPVYNHLDRGLAAWATLLTQHLHVALPIDRSWLDVTPYLDVCAAYCFNMASICKFETIACRQQRNRASSYVAVSHSYSIWCLPSIVCLHVDCYPSIWLSIYQSIYPYIYLSTERSIYIYTYISIYLFIFPSIHLAIHISMYPSIYPSIYASIHVSIHLFIFLSIHLSI